MKKRRIAAGIIDAERSFRRIKGHADMPTLIASVSKAAQPDNVTPGHHAEVA